MNLNFPPTLVSGVHQGKPRFGKVEKYDISCRWVAGCVALYFPKMVTTVYPNLHVIFARWCWHSLYPVMASVSPLLEVSNLVQLSQTVESEGSDEMWLILILLWCLLLEPSHHAARKPRSLGEAMWSYSGLSEKAFKWLQLQPTSYCNHMRPRMRTASRVQSSPRTMRGNHKMIIFTQSS